MTLTINQIIVNNSRATQNHNQANFLNNIRAKLNCLTIIGNVPVSPSSYKVDELLHNYFSGFLSKFLLPKDFE